MLLFLLPSNFNVKKKLDFTDSPLEVISVLTGA
jgi:hypothetical protein